MNPLPFSEARAAIMVAIKAPGLVFIGPGGLVASRSLSACISAPLREKGLLARWGGCPANDFKEREAIIGVGVGDTFICVLGAMELLPAFETIRDTLSALDALRYAEIGSYDPRESFWRGWHPSDAKEPLQRFEHLIYQWFGLTKPKFP